jgi:hypothetical protein
VDTQTGLSAIPVEDKDIVSADALSDLLEMAKTQLVVITSCESLVLAAALLKVTNVVATNDMVSPQMMAAWVENFYKMLTRQPLSQSFEYAVKASRAPMKFYGRQSKSPDLMFTVAQAKAHGI